MNKENATYFFDVIDGKVVSIVHAMPPHTLLKGQVALSYKEYWLMENFATAADLDVFVEGIKEKAKSVGAKW